MGLKLEPKEGNTILSAEETDQLIPKYITTRTQLDEAEQSNIEEAIQWLFSLRTLSPEKVFSVEFQDLLHKKMFQHVWKWAGKQRTRETNIGIKPKHISIERRKLNDDALFWLENDTWSAEETAIRFHHRLVQIHCYPNGNGRHARIVADVILERLYKKQQLIWMHANLMTENEDRRAYITALKAADKGNYKLLLNCIKIPKGD